jgi:hypothetical protein
MRQLEEHAAGAKDMPWSDLISRTEFAPEARYRAPARRPSKERSANAEGQPDRAAPEQPQDAFQTGRFKTDLTQLQPFDGARDAAEQASETDQQLFDFFDNLAALLLAVRAGDINRARSAADALETDVLVERSAGGRTGAAAQLLDGLGALFDAAQSRDGEAAHLAAQELAVNFQSAAAPAPEPQAEQPDDGGAAYETLTQYLDGEAGEV